MPHIVTQQTKQEGTFSFQPDVDGFLRVNCTRIPEQGANLPSQGDVMVRPEEASTAQAVARQECARLAKNWQQRGETAWGTDQIKHFDPEG